jgi:hypothetical protein
MGKRERDLFARIADVGGDAFDLMERAWPEVKVLGSQR